MLRSFALSPSNYRSEHGYGNSPYAYDNELKDKHVEWARHVGPMERDARIYIMMTTSFCATKTIGNRLEVTSLLVTNSFHRMAAMIPKAGPKSLKRRGGGRLIDLSQIWFLHPVHEASNRLSNYPPITSHRSPSHIQTG